MLSKDIALALIAVIGGIITMLVRQYLDRKSSKKDSNLLKETILSTQSKVVAMASDISDLKSFKIFDIKLPNIIQELKDNYIKMVSVVSDEYGNQYEKIVIQWCEIVYKYCSNYYYSDLRKSEFKKDLERMLKNEMNICENQIMEFIKNQIQEVRLKEKRELHFIDVAKKSKLYAIDRMFIARLVQNGFTSHDVFLGEVRSYLKECFDTLIDDIRLFREAKIITIDDI